MAVAIGRVCNGLVVLAECQRQLALSVNKDQCSGS